ncbi:MAG TPA: histone deacetylase family protein [Xanthobacteraceae bacterium]|nr:histone deacetylase family protein [Xanthobacteraceae bacterium]
MTTLFLTHEACLRHDMGYGHPECPARLVAVNQALLEPRFEKLLRGEAPEGTLDAVAFCHSEHYIQELRYLAPTDGVIHIDGDTAMSPGSWEAILRSVGGATAATEAVLTGIADNAFVATRPPGHHAEIGHAMGFCFFDNAAIAARYAQRRFGIERVAVVDFDVHHGNGTQDIFWADPTVMYCSTHEMPLFPGTGAASERGDHGTIVNAPLRPGDGSEEFRAAFEERILPRLRAFAPEFLVISAGFDAHRNDPLATLELEEADFAWVTHRLMDIAATTAEGRIVSVLEGGYDLQSLAESVKAHVGALMATRPLP